jgi:hypothetical protein
MKILTTKPPNWQRIADTFPVDWNSIIIAYYPNIHCGVEVSNQKQAHEEIHLSRQRDLGVDLWWEYYLTNPSFRLNEEVEAYKVEVAWVKENIATRNQRRFLLDKIYSDLSGSVYGFICSYDEAKRMLS